MQTSLNNLKLVDDHLLGLATPQDKLLLDAHLILNPALHEDIYWHKQAHGMVQQYSRKQLRAEIEAVHQKLFNMPEDLSFRQKILRFFER
ncbi:hypothetical protein ACFQZI_19130 [Mucilaginibacter lutimaris]|uniref:Uncharacterized protein n=1 Tax=Mucilaginibacter lutimaris TaxID=931629 RepID=A0ABW2ZL87_9SPHI